MPTSVSRPLRLAVVTAISGLLLLLTASPAFAHTRLVSSNPSDGATLSTGPGRVSLTFNEEIPADFTAITVIGPDKKPYQTGKATSDGSTISIAVAPLGPAGRYDIGYRVISEDGHPVTASIGFTLTSPGPAAAPTTTTAATTTQAVAAAATSTPAPVAEPVSSQGGTPVWPWVAGAVVLVALSVAAVRQLSRR